MKIFLFNIFLILIFFTNISTVLCKTRCLTIYYYDRPPYYFTDSFGIAHGIIIDKVRKILDIAKLKYKFENVPVKRVFYLLIADEYACSPGWYKTKERIKKFKYTLPIYQSEPSVVVINYKKCKKLKCPKNISIKKLLKSRMILGLISGFKYGDIIDSAIKKYNPNVNSYTVSVDTILKMVARGRVDYTFVSKENINYLFNKNPELKRKLKIIGIKEIKKGSNRYIICSKKVSDRIIEKINKAIKIFESRKNEKK